VTGFALSAILIVAFAAGFLIGLDAGFRRAPSDVVGEGVRRQVRRVVQHERFCGENTMISHAEVKLLEGDFEVIVKRKGTSA
jgi:hypothetical protein